MNEPLESALQIENKALKAQLIQAHGEFTIQLAAMQLLVDKFREELRLMRTRQHGASSEQGQYQGGLFDEAEQAVREMPPEVVHVAAHTKTRPCRRPLPADLPRFAEVHPLASETCPLGHVLTPIEPIRSEQLDIIPAQVFVRVHVRQRGVCRQCNTPPVTADLPPQPIPKSNASPGLIAYTATSKFVDGMPIYRQSAAHARSNIDLPRHTLGGYMVAGGELITPLVNLLTDVLLDGGIVNMDETPVQVLKEPQRAAQSKSTMWVMRGGVPGQAVVRFEYDVSRSGAVVERLLAGYNGYLQRDGYAAYKKVSAREGVIGLGCWAHVRRAYVDAVKGLPANAQRQATRTQQGVAFITALYEIEKRIRDQSADERKATRIAEAMPILSAFKAWMDAQLVPPTSALGRAIHYTLREWPYLTNYCLDGRLSIDNNPAENAIRPFVIGRKNWLFSDTQDGAVASANFYTMVETAKANGLNPYAYLKHVFTELPKAERVEDMEALLPWNVSAEKLADMLRVPSFEQP